MIEVFGGCTDSRGQSLRAAPRCPRYASSRFARSRAPRSSCGALPSRVRCDRRSHTLAAARYEAIGCSMHSASPHVLSQTCEGVTAYPLALPRPLADARGSASDGFVFSGYQGQRGSMRLGEAKSEPTVWLASEIEVKRPAGREPAAGGGEPPDCLLWTARGAPPTRSGGWGTAGQPMAGRDKADSLRPSEDSALHGERRSNESSRRLRCAKSMTAPWAAGLDEDLAKPSSEPTVWLASEIEVKRLWRELAPEGERERSIPTVCKPYQFPLVSGEK
jgi:hypothetical protein